MIKILFLDNKDSFTYNLVEELRSLNFDVEVYRNTVDASYIENKVNELKSANVQPVLFLSPGPGTPSQAGCLMDVLDKLVGQLPILGVCLGHQAIAQHLGGDVTLAGETVHGKSSIIEVTDHVIFNDVIRPVSVARYHSLKVDNLPQGLEVIANYQGLPMAMVEPNKNTVSFQFHPESILTTDGSIILKNAIDFLINNESAKN